MSLTLNCARCGHPMPPMPDEVAADFLRVGGSATAEHAPGDCPHERAATEQAAASTAPRLRRFAARVHIVEVLGDGPDEYEEPLAGFSSRATAVTAKAAMQPGPGSLREQFDRDWDSLAQQVGFADLPAIDPPASPGT